MASDLEKKAKEAFVDDNFDLAIELYTQALDLDPRNADLYADRAQANIKLGSFTEAVSDANKAIELDPSMTKAYIRKGTACMKLEEYQTAKAALESGFHLAPNDTRFSKLIKECEDYIAEETGLSEKVIAEVSSSSMPSPPDVVNGAGDSDPDIEKSNQSVATVVEKQKYRHDYYNTSSEVVLSIFAKGIPKENVLVDFGEQILSVTIEKPGEEAYHLQPRLFAKIIPERCRYDVLSTKVEIRLFKAEPITWTTLEYIKDKVVPQKIIAPTGTRSSRPAYPSSKANVDWDKLEAQVKKEEKDEKLEGDAALNKLFRDIYKDADEDTRRAMMKSFVESNGTVLSTNWKEVGSKMVEGSPPDGMELKRWEY